MPRLRWRGVNGENNQVHVRRRWIGGYTSQPKSKKSKAGGMAPLLAKYLRAWQMGMPYAKPADWVFASL